MPQEEYQVRLTADTKAASDKLDAVQNTLKDLTSSDHSVRVAIDAAAMRRAAAETQDIANNIKRTRADAAAIESNPIVNAGALTTATALATQIYRARKDVQGLGGDLGEALSKTNFGEFMRTDEFLKRVSEEGRARTRDIVEAYQGAREIPGVADALGPLENYARSQAFQQFGSAIAEQTLNGVRDGLQQGAKATKDFLYGDLFNDIGIGINNTIDQLGRLGLAIQGVQLLVGPLAAAWGALFDTVIGQNVRLQQTILATQTTLASTGQMIDKTTGQLITDPLLKINALETQVTQAVDNIRVRSLDLAGVTSQQIIEIFGVVATSISQVNGTIKDAEDLAISFTAALGTLGIPFFQARQEIGSILGGYITEDSLLAKRLQISNQDIEKAKNSVDGVVGYLQKKLEVAVAGQSIQAKGFAGVTSNIQEVFEVMAQRIGAPLLEPILAGLTGVYNFLKKIQGVVIQVGTYISTVIAKSITQVFNILSKSKVLQGVGQALNNLAEPYERLEQSLRLGLGTGGDLLQKWISGTAEVPKAMKGVIASLQGFGSFLALQLELIADPILKFLDQTRERATGLSGVVQMLARSPQAILGAEFGDAFSIGWDTLSSTIQAAGQAIGKFAIALAQLKITEFTAQIRAAATVFELFGSVLLGRINLALQAFSVAADIAGSDAAKLFVSFLSINRLMQSTDFLGMRGLLTWAVQVRPIFQRLIGDLTLFYKGFKDAGNVDKLISDTQKSYQNLFALQAAKSKNPVVQNAAEIKVLEERLQRLNTISQQWAARNKSAEGMERLAKATTEANTKLAELQKQQQSFNNLQRATAAVKTFMGEGKDIQAAKEAARQASVIASGAASAQALSGVLDTLAQRLGLTRDQLNSVKGAASAAGKALQTFMTTTIMLNLAFAALSLGVAALVSWYQQLEERERKVTMTRKNMIAINGILVSGYESVFKAAEGGDMAAKRLLETQRELAQSQFNTDSSDLARLRENYAKLNNEVAYLLDKKNQLAKTAALSIPSSNANIVQVMIDKAIAFGVIQKGIEIFTGKKQEELNKNKRDQVALEQRIYQTRLALSKLDREEKLSEDVKVLAERRLDLEKQIARAREDYTKEVTDKEFQSRIEILNLEEARRSKMVEMEKAALAQRYQLLINGSNDQEAKVLQLVQEYETALLEAADNEAKRRNDMLQREMQFRKDIEDYVFKMARERSNLEKQIGGYQKQMEEYKTKAQALRNEKEIAHMKSIEALKGANYQPYNLEAQQSFINATQRPGARVDSRIAYAMLQVVPKELVRLQGTDSGEVAIEKLRASLNGVEINMAGLYKVIKDYTNGQNVESLARALLKDAENALNLSRFTTKSDPSSLAVPNLTIDWAGLQSRIESWGRVILDKYGELLEAQAAGDAQRLQLLLEKMKDPTNYGVLLDYTSELAKGETAIENFILGLKNWSSGLLTAEAEINAVNQQFEAEVRAIVSRRMRSDLRPDGSRRYSDEEIAGVASQVVSGDYSSYRVPIDRFMIESRRVAAENAKEIYKSTLKTRGLINSNQSLLQQLQSQFGGDQIRAQSKQLFDGIFQQFTQLTQDNNGSRYSLANSLAGIDTMIEQLKLSILSNLERPLDENQTAALDAATKVMRDRLVTVTKALDPAAKAIEDFRNRLQLATQATEGVIGAYRNFLSSFLSGNTDIKALVTSFVQEITKTFSDMLIEYAIAPLKEQFGQQFKDLFGVKTAEQKAADALKQASTSFTSAVREFGSAVDKFTSPAVAPEPVHDGVGGSDLPRSMQVDAPSTVVPIDMPSSSTLSVPTVPFTPTPDAAEAARDAAKATDNYNKKIKEVAPASEEAANGLQKTIGGITSLAFSAMAIYGGISQMSEGGTQNTLLGLAGIFAGIGGIASGFAPGGGLAGLFRASGGPVSANRPYITGERGPELFLPAVNGTVVPNSALPFQGSPSVATANQSQQANAPMGMASIPFTKAGEAPGTYVPFTKATPESGNPMAALANQPLRVEYESQVINNVEYVSAEQHRKGMAEAANRGRELALASLQNSVKTRRRVGL